MALTNGNKARVQLALEIMQEITMVAGSFPAPSPAAAQRRIDRMVAIYCALETGDSIDAAAKGSL